MQSIHLADQQAARAFLKEDPDADGRALLEALLQKVEAGDADARAELRDRFDGTLAFGTAGLRAQVGPGTNRMNRVVVSRTSYGLGQYLLQQQVEVKTRGVVIGFDGRRTSRQFAEDTACVLNGMGIRVHIFDDIAATPQCAYAVTHLNAAAGVMVTASHNPPLDNGYKVYWGNGAQIIPPHDTGIAAAIDKSPSLQEMKRPSAFEAAQAGLRHAIADDVTATYLKKIAQGRLRKEGEGAPLHVVYTAMHGVGHPLLVRAMRTAGITGITVVPEQTEPDGTFYTVAFPNPEEKGALDRAWALAETVGADLVIANDPDADRLSVSLLSATSSATPRQRCWRALSGNEVGALLGAEALELAQTGGKKKLVINSLVSSTMLGRMAKNLGASFASTLTGFKWIANVALQREADHDEAFIFGYEEALGYSVGPLVRDKDGISAAVRLAELASALKAQGKTLHDRLAELQVQHGLSQDLTWSRVLPGSDGRARIDGVMTALRDSPLTEFGDSKVQTYTDLARADVPANVVVFETEAGTRLTVRPSGTEPKIKFYLDATEEVSDVAALAAAKASLLEQLKSIQEEVMERLSL